MLGGIEAALTGMQTAGRMLGASAHNIANAQTDGFKRLKSIPEEGSVGGVRVTLAQDHTAGSAFLAMHEGSHVDIQEELINTLEATQLFEANVGSLKVQSKLLGTLLDIVE